MKYGIELGAAGEFNARILAELAQVAEEARWDGIFLEDYIIHWAAPDIPTYDPWVSLTAMALNTHTIRLGTTVTPLPRRRPWKLAREAVTLDHLSKGRLILGIGLGGSHDPRNFDQLGEVTDIKQRAQMLDEGLAILAGLWSGKPFSYTGQHYQIDDVTFLPEPVQKPRIPVWIGGGWPGKPIQRAVSWDGFIPYKNPNSGNWEDMTPEDIRAIKAYLESQRTTSAPFDLAIGGRQRGSDWERERALIRSWAEAGATWWMEGLPPADLKTMREWIKQGPLYV